MTYKEPKATVKIPNAFLLIRLKGDKWYPNIRFLPSRFLWGYSFIIFWDSGKASFTTNRKGVVRFSFQNMSFLSIPVL